MQVGYAWIQHKLENDYTSAASAQAAMDAGPVPAVIGPGPSIYIVDDHHSSCALDFSGFDDTTVTFAILCDLRTTVEDEFWNILQKQNLAYLAAHMDTTNSLPVQISWKQLPNRFSFTASDQTLSDDPWRSLAGYSRKVEHPPHAPACSDSKYCERCMFRGCGDGFQKSGHGVAYFEFRWAYFMNDATYHTPSWWASESDRQVFLKLYEALPVSVVGKVDTSDWMKVAENVISLCRANTTGEYKLDTVLYPGTTNLPGYVSGYVPLPDDPSCLAPTCIA